MSDNNESRLGNNALKEGSTLSFFFRKVLS